MIKLIEQRLVPFKQFELREADGKLPELVGHASVFNQETVIESWWDSWREEVSPGAYKKTIKEHDIRSLFNHDPNILLGRNKAGTLELSEDEIGLYSIIRPPDNEWGRPVLDAVRRGDVTGMSISFIPIREEWWFPPKDSKELPKRTLKESKLFDIGPVTFPAFEQTDISARTKAIQADGEKDVLLLAGMLARRAEHGYRLTSEERKAIADAIDLLQNVSEAPVDQGHSSSVSEAAPDLIHSAEARARRLRLMQILIGEQK